MTAVSVMHKRLSSLALIFLLAGSVFAGAARVRDEHVCAMAGMEMMPGMETMPCCKEEQVNAPNLGRDAMGGCCIAIPQAPGSSGTTFRLSLPSFSVAVVHPAVVQSPSILSKNYERLSTQVFLPNLQATYIRNLSILI